MPIRHEITIAEPMMPARRNKDGNAGTHLMDTARVWRSANGPAPLTRVPIREGSGPKWGICSVAIDWRFRGLD